MNCISFRRNEGRFNLLDLKQIDAQYILYFGKFEDEAKKLKLQRSFLVGTEYDNKYELPNYSALELCNEIRSVYTANYRWNEDLKALNKVIEFLESVDEENQIETCKDMIKKLDGKIDELNREKASYENTLKELNA